jgi:hypothetical protein
MKNIIVYTRALKAQNLYPRRIISPPAPNKCCAARMEVLGRPRVDEHGRKFCYKRCKVCGFALRHFLEPVGTVLPPAAPDARNRKSPPMKARVGISLHGITPQRLPTRQAPAPRVVPVGRTPVASRHLPGKARPAGAHARIAGRKTAPRRRP